MALPTTPHTFGLENCRDVLDKLEWEIEQLSAETEMPALSYKAFNCALTAWHISDWVFTDMEREGRPPASTKKDFQRSCRAKSPALRSCWLITNASKHAGLGAYKQEITAEIGAEAIPARFGQARFGDRFMTYRWHITITDDAGKQRNATEVFDEALSFWTQLIYGEKVAAG